MAEAGTFLGEVQRGWQRFWRLSWWWKAPILAVLVLFVMGGIGAVVGGGEEKKPEHVAATTTATASPKRTATRTTRTATPRPSPATATPSPLPTAAPTPVPTAEPTPAPPSFEQQVEKSYRDNQNFAARASADRLKISWIPRLDDQGGILRMEICPCDVLTNGDYLTIAAHSALVASRAVWTTYPDVLQIKLDMLGEFTEQFGEESTEIAASITVVRATGERLQYDGLKVRVYDDNKHLFCISDHYWIHPAIYGDLDDTGCLAQWGFTK